MNVYDFDKTIYDGDSSIDFYVFNLKESSQIILYAPKQLIAGLLYKLHLIEKTTMKQAFYSYFRMIPDMDKRLEKFWKVKAAKIKPFYQSTHQTTDVIISASPEFLLEPICKRLNVRLIASNVDKKTGKYTGKNCFGEEKVKRFRQKYPHAPIDTFYSDSLSDESLAKLAKKAVFVVGNDLKEWPSRKVR
jgi:HAD superfamily phosphoserine phosphatase-like hydrolase